MVFRGAIWVDQSDPSFTQKHFPGSPAPEGPGEQKPAPKPFRLEDDLWGRVASRRLARSAGTEGFANARAVRNLVDGAVRRQAARITAERERGGRPDVFLLTREDLLGPRASREALEGSKAYQELIRMEGLEEVKEEVDSILSVVIANGEREEQEKKLIDLNLNRIFLG